MPLHDEWIEKIEKGDATFTQLVTRETSQIDDEDIQYLVEAILDSKNQFLKRLALPAQSISDVGVTEISKLLHLETLELEGNEWVTDASVPSFLKMDSLVNLDISQTNITKSGLTELLTSKSLKQVHVAHLKITEQNILKRILENKVLEELTFDDSSLTEPQKQQIAAQLKTNKEQVNRDEFSLNLLNNNDEDGDQYQDCTKIILETLKELAKDYSPSVIRQALKRSEELTQQFKDKDSFLGGLSELMEKSKGFSA